jgi:uncharacterized membrane protein YphA (DoxX/SURF4 family)
MVVVVIAIMIVMAAFARLFEFMAAAFCLRAAFTMSADSFVQIPFCFLYLAVAAVVIAIQGLGRKSAAAQEG